LPKESAGPDILKFRIGFRKLRASVVVRLKRFPMARLLPDRASFDSRFIEHHCFPEIGNEIA
jgi:hypothetical protein